MEEVEREILAAGVGRRPKTDLSTVVVQGVNRKKVNIDPKLPETLRRQYLLKTCIPPMHLFNL